MKPVTIRQLLLIIIMIPAICSPAFAHKVRIFAWQDGDNIVTESKFSKGRPAQNATITVAETESGKDLLSGTTDKEGIYSFPIPQTNSQELKIIVDGGDGHKNSWNYRIEPSSSASSAPSTGRSNPAPEQIPDKVSKQLAKHPSLEKSPGDSLQTLTSSELTLIVEAALDKKLASIKRTLAENSDQGPSLQDILGGIGYILGLAGIAAYVQSLKNKKE